MARLMTWNELKEKVDEFLKEHDLTGDIPVWLIDFSFPDADRPLNIRASGEFSEPHLVISE